MGLLGASRNEDGDIEEELPSPTWHEIVGVRM
jgi:hypothetical protein